MDCTNFKEKELYVKVERIPLLREIVKAYIVNSMKSKLGLEIFIFIQKSILFLYSL